MLHTPRAYPALDLWPRRVVRTRLFFGGRRVLFGRRMFYRPPVRGILVVYRQHFRAAVFDRKIIELRRR